jgi:hypothetical protein
MVRYYEILEEDLSNKNRKIENILKKYFVPDTGGLSWEYGITHEIINGRVNILKDARGVRSMTSEKMEKLPISFGTIIGRFGCERLGLTTLENSPTELFENDYSYSFNCANNNLTSLKYLPKNISMLFCQGNPFISLEGLDSKTIILRISITFTENLPLLRLLVASHSIKFEEHPNDILSNSQIKVKPIQDILNNHIKQYENINQRVLRCKDALIEAGYRDNAKW